MLCRYATELATTLRRGGFEAHPTSDLEKRKEALLTRKEAQQKRNDPQITHTIADLAAIQLVRFRSPPHFLSAMLGLGSLTMIPCCKSQVLDAREKALVRATRDSASVADSKPDPEML